MSAVGSAVLHGVVAAAFLMHSAEPLAEANAATEPSAVSVELVRLPAVFDKGAAEASGDQPERGDQARQMSSDGASPSPAASTGSGEPTGDAISAPPVSALNVEAFSDYFQRLESHLSRHHRYPALANGARPEGTVRVAMIIGRNGNLLDCWIETSSGVADLDDAALATVRRAAPMPGVPESLPGAIDLVVPLRFTRAGAA